MCKEQELYDFDLENDSNPFGELNEDEINPFPKIANDPIFISKKTDKDFLIEKILKHAPVILEKEQLEKLPFTVLAEIMEIM